jgi:hypothetical protein
MAAQRYYVWSQLSATPGETFTDLKNRLIPILAEKLLAGEAQALSPEKNLAIRGTERAFPSHQFDPDAVNAHAYRHGGEVKVFADYTFIPRAEELV